ncbi:MAG: 2-amino-4-hydroxy-6-hydroxymethyldihydropteridine diphosphokinase [Armatimonadota bacterium]|jgi:dihydroneopterin aldolase/2-amino-4-hydroxy-6-hydroxymethyldihydropteridine diphosphokinase
MARAFVSVGSNIAPADNVLLALRRLAGEVRIVAVSTFYRTAPLGRPEQPDFYNGVVAVETELSPADLKHAVLRHIEEQLGRERTEDKYAPRTIDLDVLLYDELVMDTGGLAIPDPDIARRPFLAIPLHEVAPGLVLPGSGRPMADIAAELAHHDMQPLPEYTELLRESVGHGSREG